MAGVVHRKVTMDGGWKDTELIIEKYNHKENERSYQAELQTRPDLIACEKLHISLPRKFKQRRRSSLTSRRAIMKLLSPWQGLRVMLGCELSHDAT